MFIHSDEKIVISCLRNLLETFVCYQNTEPKLLATPELFPTCFTLEKLIFYNSIRSKSWQRYFNNLSLNSHYSVNKCIQMVLCGLWNIHKFL